MKYQKNPLLESKVSDSIKKVVKTASKKVSAANKKIQNNEKASTALNILKGLTTVLKMI